MECEAEGESLKPRDCLRSLLRKNVGEFKSPKAPSLRTFPAKTRLQASTEVDVESAISHSPHCVECDASLAAQPQGVEHKHQSMKASQSLCNHLLGGLEHVDQLKTETLPEVVVSAGRDQRTGATTQQCFEYWSHER